MMTGVLPHGHGLWANGVALPPGQPVFSKQLADAGYFTALAGKMHLAAAYGGRTETRYDDGIEHYAWAHDPAHRSPENAYHGWLQREHPELWADPPPAPGGFDARPYDDMPTQAHFTTWVADEVIDILENRPAGRPFFCWANIFDPHHPFVAPREYVERYRDADLPAPIRPNAPADHKPAIQDETSRETYGGALPGFLDYTAEQIRAFIARYYAMVDLIDDQVGRILQSLDRLDLAEDTLVVFTSDHGEMLGDHGQLLKGPLCYEGATRVPLILRWPGRVPAGVRRPEIASLLDLPTTLLAAAGLGAPDRMTGRDVIAGPGAGYAVCEYRDSGHPLDPAAHVTMLATETHKLVAHHGPPASARPATGELYDLADDPDELVNRWDDPACAAVKADLLARLLDVLVAAEDRSAGREAFW